MPCHQGSNCESDTCTNGTCAPKVNCTPIYSPASSVNCGIQILPNNGCGTVPNGTGTYCATGTCNGTTCVSGCTPTYPPANTVACGTSILPNNGCGTTPNGNGTYCATGACNGTSCVVPTTDFTISGPPTLSVTVPTTGTVSVSAIITIATADTTSKVVALTVTGAPAGTTASLSPTSVTVANSSGTSTLLVTVPYTLAASTTGLTYPLTVTGVWSATSHSMTINLVAYTAGGTGKANGATCTAHTECSSLNCGPLWSATKTCNGDVEIDQTPQSGNAFDCHSGVFIQGTTKCAPDQFRLCVSRTGVGVQVYTDTAWDGGYYVGADKCLTSDPARNHRSMMENGDLTGCSQRTWWAPNGTTCVYVVPNYRATWNGGRVYQQ
jgi:hypothetical protein